MDTFNKYGIGLAGAEGSACIAIMKPPLGHISKADALLLAAWLVALADPLGERFPEFLKAVQNS